MLKTVDDIEVGYDVKGPWGRPWVVMVHGFPFTRALWQAEAEALSRDFQVLTYDLRGLGESELGDKPASIDTYVDDLLELMGRLGIQRAGLVGLSLGGYIALRAVVRAEPRFWALALCDTASTPDHEDARLGRDKAMQALDDHGVAPFVSALLPRLLVRPDSVAGTRLMSLMLGNDAPGMKFALTAMRDRADTTRDLVGFELPVLVIVGSEDTLTPPSAARAIVAHVGGARLDVLADAGHVSNLESPAAFITTLGMFLERAAPSARGSPDADLHHAT